MPILLSELNALIQATVEQKFRGQSFDVIAEIGQVTIKKDKQQAHIGLVEKSELPGKFKARLEAKLWRNLNLIDQFEQATGQPLKAGLQVLFKLSIQFHPEYGISAQVLHIDPNYTIGALAQEKEKTIQKLLLKHPDKIRLVNGELKSHNQSLSLPLIIQRIALITAKGAEGGIDFLDELIKNRHGYTFHVVPFFAVMQGETAAESIKQAIVQVFLSQEKFDVIVVVRGGGAALDLHAFDQMALVEAILKCPIPIFTGIGHTRNVSLTDQVANGAFKSPTKVAEVILHHQENAESIMLEHWQNIQQSVPSMLINKKQSINSLQLTATASAQGRLSAAKSDLQNLQVVIQSDAQNLVRQAQSGALQQWKDILKAVPKNLHSQNGLIVQQWKQISKDGSENMSKKELALKNITQFVEAHSPKKWLNRGFGILKQQGKTISSLDQLQPETPLVIEMKDGTITTLIQNIDHD
jgi:exodeoxyribonuclease VII large subunit